MKNLKTLLWISIFLMVTQLFAQGKFYASNRVLNAVNTYEEDGTYIEEFIAQNAGGLSNPQDIIIHPDSFLLVTGTNNEQIKKFDLETGEYLGDWSDPNFALSNPSKMSIGPDDTLYVTQWGTTQEGSKIVRFDLQGNYLGAFTPSAPQGLGHVWDTDGNFYLALFGLNPGNGTVRKYDSDGNFLEIFISSAFLANPAYIWWDEDTGDMLVQDWGAGKVLRYDSNGDYIGEFITGLNNPEGYTILDNGNILISERGANQITEYNPDGTLLGRWDNGGLLAGPNFIEYLDPMLTVNEIQTNDVFVTPTVSNYFHLNPMLPNDYQRIEIYDIFGKRVDTIDPQTQEFWNANAQSEGVYFMKGIRFNGKNGSQKIIVKK